jgi:hypothetical protein
VPNSIAGRFFAIFWTLFGTVLFSLITVALTTALTTTLVVTELKDVMLYASQVSQKNYEYIYKLDSCGVKDVQLPEKYKRNFDVSKALCLDLHICCRPYLHWHRPDRVRDFIYKLF